MGRGKRWEEGRGGKREEGRWEELGRGKGWEREGVGEGEGGRREEVLTSQVGGDINEQRAAVLLETAGSGRSLSSQNIP